ncbi:unnamed protein product [Brachionus calyciflorus]|uniref:Uncharacterized protein n=1 Tax=Brachionus calyciflorus TaxID=104777 RepID=A0A814NVR1_9BILA|nr:unnamed protein product [Brachionus calyciflorus]
MKYFLIFLISLGTCYCLDDRIGREEFVRFKTIYQKSYANLYEENLRYQIFALQLDRVAIVNTDFNNRRSPYKLAINQYSDLAYNEFLSRRGGFLPTLTTMRSSSSISDIPRKKKLNQARQIAAFDWRDTGYVTSVKDQQNCGGCWAFAATGAIETQWAIYYGRLRNLSEQNLIDCVVGNYGCNGGVMQLAYDYVRSNGGINGAVKYPFLGVASNCKYFTDSPVANVSSYVRIERGNEVGLEQAVREYGPVSVGINASPDFVNYNGGIYNASDCTDRLNHAVLIVGFNNVNNPPFWIVKNSWGSWWGENGYIRIIKGRNACGIANMASYPIIV